jgi:DNA-binding CsgD family transcriptional regulator
VLVGLGRVSEAVTHVDEELALAQRWGAPRTIGRALRQRAEVLIAAGDSVEALSSARSAVEVLRPTTGRLEYARALATLGTLVAPGDAVPLLRESAELLWRCCADRDYQAVVAALASRGATPPPQPPPATRLTTVERQIVTRYLGGTPERDIAEELFLTPQTVRSMIAAVRDRLGAVSRADLRHRLHS